MKTLEGFLELGLISIHNDDYDDIHSHIVQPFMKIMINDTVKFVSSTADRVANGFTWNLYKGSLTMFVVPKFTKSVRFLLCDQANGAELAEHNIDLSELSEDLRPGVKTLVFSLIASGESCCLVNIKYDFTAVGRYRHTGVRGNIKGKLFLASIFPEWHDIVDLYVMYFPPRQPQYSSKLSRDGFGPHARYAVDGDGMIYYHWEEEHFETVVDTRHMKSIKFEVYAANDMRKLATATLDLRYLLDCPYGNEDIHQRLDLYQGQLKLGYLHIQCCFIVKEKYEWRSFDNDEDDEDDDDDDDENGGGGGGDNDEEEDDDDDPDDDDDDENGGGGGGG
ncbi:hypothetical protein A2U01_0000792, partial [Trifolium medium]|nr:hypothetical protein [Trifolium medium]